MMGLGGKRMERSSSGEMERRFEDGLKKSGGLWRRLLLSCEESCLTARTVLWIGCAGRS